MLQWIVGSSIRFRVLVAAAVVAILTLGVVQLRNASVDVLPEFLPPQVEVQTEALGLSAAEVEQLITVPLEADLLSQVPFLDQIRSESVPGLSSIVLVFEPETDLMQARQLVQERLGEALIALPNAMSQPPAMLQPLSSASRVMMIRLTSDQLSLIDLSVLARWKIKPRLMGVPGVANVSTFGQRERELQVQVDPEQLQAKNITLGEVVETTANALWASPLSFVEASTPGTGGFIDTPSQRLTVQHILPITTPAQLSRVALENGLRLGDVAKVVQDHQPLIGDSVGGPEPSLMLVVEKFPGQSTQVVTQEIEKALEAMHPGLTGIKLDATVYRPATSIEQATSGVIPALLIGLGLVVLLLAIYFLDWRSVVVSVVAILASVLSAALVLYLTGTTFNAMVLAGLTVAIGLVIADAVSDIDHLRLRLRENRQSGKANLVSNVLEASREIRGPAFFATLIALLAAVPFYFAAGLTGAFSRPLVAAYVLALIAAMLVGLIVTPALTVLLSSERWAAGRASPVAEWLGRTLTAPLARLARRPVWAYAATGLLAVAGIAMIPLLGVASLAPSVNERDLLVRWETAPGTSLPAMTQISNQVTAELRAVPGVRNVGSHVGRAVTSDQVVGINSGEMWISIDPDADYTATLDAIDQVIDGHPGLHSDLQTYPDQQLADVQAGTQDAITVRMYGQDPAVLERTAGQVRTMLSGIDGVSEPQVESTAKEPTAEIKVDLTRAEQHGIKPGDVRRTAAIVMAGIKVGNLFEDQKVFDVVVRGTPETRSSLRDISNLRIDTPEGEQVRLEDVADVSIEPNPTVIKRDAVSRYLDITADVEGRDIGEVSQEIETGLQRMAFPIEYHAELLGETEAEQAANWRMLAYVLAAALLIFLLLQAAFRSWRLAFLGFVLLLASASGGLLSLLALDREPSLGALIGLIAVVGIAARSLLMLVRRYQQLARDDLPGPELVDRGTRERIGPIILTLLGAAAILLPLLFASELVRDVVEPMVIVVLCSLVTSTLVSLFVLPTLYLRKEVPDAAR